MARDRAASPLNRPYTDLVYSRCWSCCPICARTASRPSSSPAADRVHAAMAENVYGIPPEQVVGSTVATKFQMGPATSPSCSWRPRSNSSTTAGQAGRHQPFHRPAAVFAFGNSDGDQQMLEWTAAGAARVSWGSCTIRTPSANRPMTASRNRKLDKASTRPDARLDGRRHEARLEHGVSVRMTRKRLLPAHAGLEHTSETGERP